MIYNNIHEMIGNTPMIKIDDLMGEKHAPIYLKLEWFNPGGSVKDRIAINMIESAEQDGLLKPGDTIVEPTSGNTGIGIAMVAASKGYKAILTMPSSLSVERRTILEGYGATLILNDTMDESIQVAKQMADEFGYFMPMQFKNINNPLAHMNNTALEILKDLHHIDYFIAAVGTGGTITGVGTILKEELPNISIKAVEPVTSSVLSGNGPGPHKIQGIGAGFVPDILDTSIYDEVITVTDKEAFETARLLHKKYGLFVGISTGANIAASYKIAKNLDLSKIVVTVSPSNAERYLSTELFKKDGE